MDAQFTGFGVALAHTDAVSGLGGGHVSHGNLIRAVYRASGRTLSRRFSADGPRGRSPLVTRLGAE